MILTDPNAVRTQSSSNSPGIESQRSLVLKTQ
jgi:hypothetical protein